MFLGDAIRSRRQTLGMSQEHLARLASTSTRTISRIELGQVAPHPETVGRIAVALGVKPDFFAVWMCDTPSWRIRAAQRRNAAQRELVA